METERTIQLEYWNGEYWSKVGDPWVLEKIAWISLGGYELNYRTVDLTTGKVLTDMRDDKTKYVLKEEEL